MSTESLQAQNVFAALDSRIWQSSDGGGSWQVLPDLFLFATLSTVNVSALAVDSSGVVQGGLYAGANFTPGLFRYRGGTGWTQLPACACERVLDLAADPTTPGLLFVASHSGVERTKDGGETFDELAPPPGLPARIFFAANPPTLYAVISDRSLYRYEESVPGWTKVHDAAGQFGVLAIDTRRSATIFFYDVSVGPDGFKLHVRKTTDGFATSTELTLPAEETATGNPTLWLDPTTPDVVYVNSGYPAPYALSRSTDGGATWTPAGQGLGAGPVQTLAFTPTKGAFYAVLPGRGVFKTTTGG